MTESGSYKKTVNLPKTKFDMRANATKREPEIQKFWNESKVYERLSKENPGELFILHDGPPYANGSLHIGHALNKILKDIINRYKILQGRKINYVPGWDCHGLPIELKVLQAMKSQERQNLTPLKLRQKAKEFAMEAVNEQRESFKRYGVWGDWEHPYLTSNPQYEAAQIAVFGDMFLKGYIYRGLKPVHWSPSSKTALAEAELEYPEGHTSPSIYAAFPMTNLGDAVKDELSEYLPELGVAIWTTTPWTIPGNLAVAVNPELNYAVVEPHPLAPSPQDGRGDEDGRENNQATSSPPQEGENNQATSSPPQEGENNQATSSPSQEGENNQATSSPSPQAERGIEGVRFRYLIVAADLAERLSETFGAKLTVKATFKGKDLENSTYRHPLFDRESPVIIGGDYITTESGTGLVHTAPGHGQEDYIVGQRYNLPILAPVDANGKFTEEAGKFVGLKVVGGKDQISEGNQAIIDALTEAKSLIKHEPYAHKYPYDWRTKKPTIFRATEQWFASVEKFRETALEEIKSIQWIPAQGQNRITPMVADRSDWCISRQRSWGVPIPVFYDEETNEVVLNEEIIKHVQAVIAEKGSDAWWQLSVEDLMPEKYRNDGRKYRKGTDTMDVWFDSGSSWASVVEQRPELRYPADVYLEGSDQHRGWFQSSLLTSVAVNGVAPYKTVLTHGYTLDEKGFKQSKSLGNVIDPRVVIEGGKNQKQDPAYGADVLRLWVSSVDYTNDVGIGKNTLKQIMDIRNKIRNTTRFLLGNLHDFNPQTDAVAFEDLAEIDKYMLHRIAEVFSEVTTAYDTFQFSRFFQSVQNFCIVDLSNFYLDVGKDRLYISSVNGDRRRSCQTVMQIALENLTKAIAPVLCHMAEDIWQFLPYETPYKSVFEAGWVQLEEKWKNPELVKFWDKIRQIRNDVNKVLEEARIDKMIGSSLEAKVLLYIKDEELRNSVKSLNDNSKNGVDELRYFFLTSQAEILDSPEIEELEHKLQSDNWDIGVTKAEGEKCDRCWNYSTKVGESKEHPLLCERCVSALAGEF